jgi:hypothetical protein
MGTWQPSRLRIERHRRVKFIRLTEKEQHNAEAVQFPPGGLTKTRRAGFKPREGHVETVCGVCKRAYMPYMPYYEDDPCIAGLPGVRFACSGHGVGEGYINFDNGVVLRFSGLRVEKHNA